MYKESRKSYRIVLIIGAALFSLAASHLQVHYTLISYSFLPFAIFLIGSFLDERDALLSQILFSLLYFTLSGFLTGVLGIAHTPISFGYVLGTVPACCLVARLVKTEKPHFVWKGFCLAMAACSLCIFIAIKDSVHLYYKYTLALSLALVFLYYLRLKSHMNILLSFTSALLIYYLCGLSGLFLQNGFAAFAKIVFRGYFLLLPGDLLTLIISVYLIPPAAARFKEKFFSV